jgi:hypothetical protein
MIKTKLITSHRVNIYIKKDFCDWFKKEYKLTLEFTKIRHGKYIYNIDKKGYYIACLLEEEVIVLIRIKEMYVKVPENRLSITVIKSISADDKAIFPLVIMLSKNIIVFWFSENMIRAEVVTVLSLGYTNKGICM